MRLVRYFGPSGPVWGDHQGSTVAVLSGSFAEGFRPTGEVVPLPDRWLAPLAPSKIICAARNYADHAREMGSEPPDEPRIFLKAPSSLVGTGEPILLPPNAGRVDPEGELAMVIGRRCKDLEPDTALEAVFGYTLVNDITARAYQKKDRIFGRAKSFDSFCPAGPWVDTDFDPTDVAIQTDVDGVVRASGRTPDMLFGFRELLVWISAIMTLEPGDVIATGTPPGVAPLKPGDQVTVRVEGLGELHNPVR